jgi:hypothetical protein
MQDAHEESKAVTKAPAMKGDQNISVDIFQRLFLIHICICMYVMKYKHVSLCFYVCKFK